MEWMHLQHCDLLPSALAHLLQLNGKWYQQQISTVILAQNHLNFTSRTQYSFLYSNPFYYTNEINPTKPRIKLRFTFRIVLYLQHHKLKLDTSQKWRKNSNFYHLAHSNYVVWYAHQQFPWQMHSRWRVTINCNHHSSKLGALERDDYMRLEFHPIFKLPSHSAFLKQNKSSEEHWLRLVLQRNKLLHWR